MLVLQGHAVLELALTVRILDIRKLPMNCRCAHNKHKWVNDRERWTRDNSQQSAYTMYFLLCLNSMEFLPLTTRILNEVVWHYITHTCHQSKVIPCLCSCLYIYFFTLLCNIYFKQCSTKLIMNGTFFMPKGDSFYIWYAPCMHANDRMKKESRRQAYWLPEPQIVI